MANEIEVDKLLEARNWIADKGNWTTGAMARDAGDNPLGVLAHQLPFNPQVSATCGVGCLYYFDMNNPTRMFVENVCQTMHGHYIASINDRLGHEAILNVFDEAICQAKEL